MCTPLRLVGRPGIRQRLSWVECRELCYLAVEALPLLCCVRDLRGKITVSFPRNQEREKFEEKGSMARPKEWTGFENVGDAGPRRRSRAQGRGDAKRRADGDAKVRRGLHPLVPRSGPIAEVRVAGRMLAGGRTRARALEDAVECDTGDNTLEEPTPSWAVGCGTPSGALSTQTLTPLSLARADLEFDAQTDPFRGTAYRGVRQIGAGGMGEVFLVLHRELGSEFVAKVLRSELRGDARTVDRVRVEAESLGRLQHPHVVSVTDFGYSAEGAPFIVMELLNGVTLAQRLKQGPVTLRDALVFTRATLSALAAAHAFGIVHRDIKPHNLFLHQREDGLILLKVLDFGVARVLPDAPPAAPIPLNLPTQTGMVLGTPRFVSPEAAAGRPVDVRGDLYAVGLVLYQLVAGRGPFDHVRGVSDVLHAHTSQVPEPPSRYAAVELPAELDRVVLKALSKRPKHRYQSALEFDAALAGLHRALVSKARSRSASPLRSPPLGQRVASPAARADRGAPMPVAPVAFRPRIASSVNPALVPRALALAALPGASVSVSADGNAARPAHLPWRPLRTVLVFVGTMLLTSLMGAGGATLLGRMVGGLP